MSGSGDFSRMKKVKRENETVKNKRQTGVTHGRNRERGERERESKVQQWIHNMDVIGSGHLKVNLNLLLNTHTTCEVAFCTYLHHDFTFCA